MSRQTDKEEREAAEREAEEKAKAKAKAKADEAKAKEPKTTDEPGEEATNPSQLQPYPQGNPPDPEDTFEKMHGFRRVPPGPAKEK